MRGLHRVLVVLVLLVGSALLLAQGGEEGSTLAARLRPALCTDAAILTRGEPLLLELEIPPGDPVLVDRDVLAGNALRAGTHGPVLPPRPGDRAPLAGGTRLVRRLPVPREWFQLPAKAHALDLPLAHLVWRSATVTTRPLPVLYLDEDLGAARVRMETSLGKMEFALEPEKAPDTVKNFLRLVRARFYDGTTFHRVIRNFIVQGGDPNTKDDDPGNDGQGGAPWNIMAEFSDLGHQPGALAMARDPRDIHSARSQFYIVQAGTEQTQLNGSYTVFGRLIEGDETLAAIGAVPLGGPGGTTPKKPVVLKRARIFYPDR